jgi:hypothetical protein
VAVILVGLATAALTALLTFASPAGSSLYFERQTDEALAQARLALIGRAAADDNRPGSLPCPDTDNDGVAELLSGNECPSYIGRLPWRTLGLPDLRDASGERLWYALSRSLRDDNSAQPINSDTAGDLAIIGPSAAIDVAAIVIAPSAALTGQNRAANPNSAAHFMEGENNDGNNTYQTATTSPAFNDRLLAITRNQLFNVVEWRVANEMRAILQNYYTQFHFLPFANSYTDPSLACTPGTLRGRIPNADIVSSPSLNGACPTNADWFPPALAAPPAWFLDNGWNLLTYYAVAPACSYSGIVSTLNCANSGGFLTVNGIPNIRAVIVVGGRAIGSQVHPCSSETDCIEQPSAGAGLYQRTAVSTIFNDKVAVIAP